MNICAGSSAQSGGSGGLSGFFAMVTFDGIVDGLARDLGGGIGGEGVGCGG